MVVEEIGLKSGTSLREADRTHSITVVACIVVHFRHRSL